MPRLSVGKTTREMCCFCLGIDPPEPKEPKTRKDGKVLNPSGLRPAHRAYDCLAGDGCPLYRAMPFRGKHPPQLEQPGGPPPNEVKRMAALEKSHPKRRPSKRFLNALCRSCHQPAEAGARDCGKQECPAFEWRPWQPGGQPKRPRTGNLPLGARTRMVKTPPGRSVEGFSGPLGA